MARPDGVPSSRPARLKLAGSLRIMSILPLTGARVEAHDGDMTNNLLLRSAPHDNRSWDGFLARVRAPSLDRQIAAGCLPGSSRALAIRARRILPLAGRPGRKEGRRGTEGRTA